MKALNTSSHLTHVIINPSWSCSWTVTACLLSRPARGASGLFQGFSYSHITCVSSCSITLWCVLWDVRASNHTKPAVSLSVITPPPPPLRHDGRALILRPRPRLSEEHARKMINGSDLIPPARARPFLNLTNPISQCCPATGPGRMRWVWAWRRWPSWAPKDHAGYISLRWLQCQLCCVLLAAVAEDAGRGWWMGSHWRRHRLSNARWFM